MFLRRATIAAALPLLVVCLGLAAGCGGGEVGTATLTGVWTGTQTRAPDGVIEYDYTLTGTTVGGTARITTSTGTIYTGTIAGTYSGNSLDVTVTWTDPAGYGTTHFTGTLSGNVVTGNYTHTPPVGAPESGTVSLTKSGTHTLTDVAGTYNGSAVRNDGTHNVTVSITVTQNGNTLSGTIAVTIPGVGTGNGNVSGTIIGNHITEGSGNVGGSAFTFDGTLNGNTFSGTWSDDKGHSGTFTLTKQST